MATLSLKDEALVLFDQLDDELLDLRVSVEQIEDEMSVLRIYLEELGEFFDAAETRVDAATAATA